MSFRRRLITPLKNSRIYCFSLWYEFFVHYSLRVEKIINMVLRLKEKYYTKIKKFCTFKFG